MIGSSLRRISRLGYLFINRGFCEKKPDQEENKNLQDQALKMQERNTRSAKYIYGTATLLLSAAFLLMYEQEQRSKKIKRSGKVWHTGKADIGGQWQLINTKTGKSFGSKDLKGNYYLIYFGFCNCPDICPITLTKLSKAFAEAQKQLNFTQLKLVFISVDPDRDTHEKINKWLAYFNPDFIGVTAKSNDDPALKETMQKFKIYASKIEYDDVQQQKRLYTIDHTILTYLMDKQSEYIVHLGSNISQQELKKNIVEKVTEYQKQLSKGKRII